MKEGTKIIVKGHWNIAGWLEFVKLALIVFALVLLQVRIGKLERSVQALKGYHRTPCDSVAIDEDWPPSEGNPLGGFPIDTLRIAPDDYQWRFFPVPSKTPSKKSV